MSCSVCSHPQRDAIDQALTAGTPQRTVAAQFGVGKSTLSRHTQHGPPTPHAPAPPARLPAAFPTVASCHRQLQALRSEHQQLLAQLQDLARRLEDAAWERNNVRDLQWNKQRLPHLEQQVRALQAEVTALQGRLAALPALVRAAEQALAEASQRRQAAWQEHWAWNEASPQQAAGYQEENLIMMRNQGFSNSSLSAVTPQQAMGNRKIETQRTPAQWDEYLEGEGGLLVWTCAIDRHYSSETTGDPPAPGEAMLRRYGSWQALHQQRDHWRERLLALYPFPDEVTHG